MTGDKHEKKEGSKKKSRRVVKIVQASAVVIALAFLAGGLGALVAFNYLSDYVGSLVAPSQPVSVGEPGRVVSPGTLESAVATAGDKVVPALAAFYKSKAGGGIESDVYYEEDRLGSGVVFTSDGWIITAGKIFEGLAKEAIVARVNGSFYPLEEINFDEITGAYFVKVNAENLPVVQIADDDFIKAGDRGLIVEGGDGFRATNIISKKFNPVNEDNLVESSEIPKERLLVAGVAQVGAPIVNYDAEVIGIASNKNSEGVVAMPLTILAPLVKSILKGGRLVRPYLGVNYIDLARADIDETEYSGGRRAGALLWDAGEDAPAVKEESPASESGLVKGDIIVSVNGQALNGHGSLAYILLEYSPGDKINLEIIRGGETIPVDATLGSLSQ